MKLLSEKCQEMLNGNKVQTKNGTGIAAFWGNERRRKVKNK